MSICITRYDNRRQEGLVTDSESAIVSKFTVSTASYVDPKLVLDFSL